MALFLTGSAAAAQCEYRGGDSITARPSADGGYDVGYGLSGFDDPATDDHCRVAAVEGGSWATCDEGFEGPFIKSGSTMGALDGGIIVLLNSVLYKVCR